MRATEAEMLAAPTSRCVNAGFSDTAEHADQVGQLALYSILSFAQQIGINCPVTAVTLDHDPLPPTTVAELLAGLAFVGDGRVIQIGVN